MVPLVARILDTGHQLGVALAQRLDEGERNGDLRELGVVVEVEAQLGRTHALNQMLVGGQKALVGRIYEVEGGQHKDAADPVLCGVLGEPNRVGESQGAGADEEALRGHTRLDDCVKCLDAFLDGEGQAFPGGAKQQRGVAAVVEEGLNV